MMMSQITGEYMCQRWNFTENTSVHGIHTMSWNATCNHLWSQWGDMACLFLPIDQEILVDKIKYYISE